MYRYDNVYLNELIRLFPGSDKDELTLLFTNRTRVGIDVIAQKSDNPSIREINKEVIINYLRKYIEQRNMEANVKMLGWTEKNEGKYQKYRLCSLKRLIK